MSDLSQPLPLNTSIFFFSSSAFLWRKSESQLCVSPRQNKATKFSMRVAYTRITGQISEPVGGCFTVMMIAKASQPQLASVASIFIVFKGA